MTLLVDTYDTDQGVRRAVQVLRGLPVDRAVGVRLDSGDLAALAPAPGASSTTPACPAPTSSPAAASTSTPSRTWSALRARRSTCSPSAPRSTPAPMRRTSTPRTSSSPTADRPVMKLSSGKMTLPGAKQVYRGPGCSDVLACARAATSGSEPMLETGGIRDGRRCAPRPPDADAVEAARRRFRTDLAALPPSARAIRRPATLRPAISPALQSLTDEVRERPSDARPGRRWRGDQALPCRAGPRP